MHVLYLLATPHRPQVIFNGNNYDEDSQKALVAAGVWHIDSGIEAIKRYTAPENVALFERMGVMNAAECAARQKVLYNHYTGTVEIEVCILYAFVCFGRIGV
jgi:glutamine synthetase